MTPAAKTAEAPAANVVEALARVARDLPGIAKGERAAQDQGGYAYRGIEAIVRAVQPLLAREGVLFVPSVMTWDRDEVLVGQNKKVWHDDRMLIVYTVYGPGGPEDKIMVGPIPAIGRDGTDKGANKCMTQAFKYALLQALCVADSKDDGDQENHEAEQPPEFITETQALDLLQRLHDLGEWPDAWLKANLPNKKNMRLMVVGDYRLADEILKTAEATKPAGESDEPAEAGTDDQAASAASSEPAPSDDLLTLGAEPM